VFRRGYTLEAGRVLTLRLGDPVPAGPRFVGAIGNFDGVHAGHRALLAQLTASARAQGLRTLAVTFWPNPRALLHPAGWLGYLATADERADLLGAVGLDALLELPFTPALASATPEAFVELLTTAVPLAELWVGEDFRFGHRRAGDVATLRALAAPRGVAVHTIARQGPRPGEPVSSSSIRALLREGKVEAAAEALGRPYALGGTVVPGDHRGRTLGYPTANLALDEGKVIPGRGIYAAHAQVGDVARPAAVSVGVRPQFGGGAELVEAYLLDFSGDLYGQRLMLRFLAKLRDEQRFASVDELLAQMARDVARVRDLTRARRPARPPSL
jgi:riboflavin kinase/FMN adenylyltransferase